MFRSKIFDLLTVVKPFGNSFYYNGLLVKVWEKQ